MTLNLDERARGRTQKPEHGLFPIREDRSELIEVHVAGVCIRRRNGKLQVLAARRSAERSLFPGKWECGGGRVRQGESFDVAIRRQIFEEFGLQIEPRGILEVYEIPIAGKQRIIPGVRFLCEAKIGRVQLNKREFTAYQWIALPVPESLDWIGGLKDVLDHVYKMYGDASPKGLARIARPIGFRGVAKSSQSHNRISERALKK